MINCAKALLLSSLLLTLSSLTLAASYGDWTVKADGSSPNQYRFAEQYAKTTDCKTQRIDFTFSKSTGWSFTVTTRNIADQVKLIIDGKSHEFIGGGPFHKLSIPVDTSLIKQVMNAQQPILLIESYDEGVSYHSVVSVKGSSAALRWVGDI